MAKTYHSSNKWALAGLFKRICQGDNPKELQDEAAHLARIVKPDDISAAQQTLIDEGFPGPLVQKISSAFLLIGLPKESATLNENQLTADHILERIFAEHALARCYLADMKQVTEEIGLLDCLTDVSSEFRRLVRTIDFFYQFRKHIHREEDIIFPYLKKFGWQGVCKAEEEEHTSILADIQGLGALISSFGNYEFADFYSLLLNTVQHFSSIMKQHLSCEEEVLWPIALVVVEDAETWNTIKMLSDDFDY